MKLSKLSKVISVVNFNGFKKQTQGKFVLLVVLLNHTSALS
jgi:hypothetical protein